MKDCSTPSPPPLPLPKEKKGHYGIVSISSSVRPDKTLRMPKLSNHRADSLQIKFNGTVLSCRCATSRSFLFGPLEPCSQGRGPSRINTWSISCEITLGWMPQNIFDDKSTLVQVLAWHCQATSHSLPEPMLTQIPVTIWRHQATMS